MQEILQDPQNPDEVARLAGQTMYDTRVGMLRRPELYRLGNAWGAKFPVGATKDYMLPFFKQLEAEGKNPLRPPVDKTLDQIVKTRAVEHEGEAHSETSVEPTLAGSQVEVHEPFYTECEHDLHSWGNTPDGRCIKCGANVPPQGEDYVATPVLIEPKPKTEFETKLEQLHMGEVRKLCKLRSIPQTPRDRKQDLIARIIAASEGTLEQDIPNGC